ncbi:hypothetical protein [Dyella acidiphila]|uniref:Uncharacterized protein n=1 Tax=Dyella acidiphila TaxID=2775866 RepID=A0ABR9GFS2_9GAMM|nr:hypothetical protein [Dyella acidiphila]MBE1162883.1 hypothetical protein [Dyella acidiphila]
MTKILAVVAILGFVSAWGVGVVAWFFAVFFAVKAVRRTKAGIRLWGRGTLWNPANILFDPQSLTSDGLAYRRKCFIAIAVFFGCIGVLLLMAVIAGNLG